MTTYVIDTNLLVLLVVGETGRRNISAHKRTSRYSADDYDVLLQIVSPPNSFTVCPHVLAEASNITRHTREPLLSKVTLALGAFVKTTTERAVPSTAAIDHGGYARLGLTDAVLLTLVASEGTLLSDDLDLCLAAERAGHRVINYNYVRDGALSLDEL